MHTGHKLLVNENASANKFQKKGNSSKKIPDSSKNTADSDTLARGIDFKMATFAYLSGSHLFYNTRNQAGLVLEFEIWWLRVITDKISW